MSGTAFCLALIMLGVNFDIQPLPGGGVEYVILVSPLDLGSLQSGSDLRSDLPPAARDVRSFCIRAVKDQPAGAGASPAIAWPSTDGRSAATAPSRLQGAPELTFPGGSKFPTSPSGMPPMPKMDVGSPDKQAARPATFEQSPFARPAMPPTSMTFKPKTEFPASSAPTKQPNDFTGPKEPTLPAADKPKPPKTSSQTGAQTLAPEPVKDSEGLLYSLMASTAGSFSGMLFFGWVAWDYRRRYYSLLSRGGRSPQTSEWEPTDEDADSEEPPVSADD